MPCQQGCRSDDCGDLLKNLAAEPLVFRGKLPSLLSVNRSRRSVYRNSRTQNWLALLIDITVAGDRRGVA